MSFENVCGRETIELVGAQVFFSIFEMNLGGQIFQIVYKFFRMGGAGSVNPRGKTSIAAMSFENVRGRGTIELVGAEVFFLFLR